MSERSSLVSAYFLAGELGYIIAIPVVLFGVGGAYLDKYLGTSPLFLAIGFLVAMLVSVSGVWSIIKRLKAEEERSEKKDSGDPGHTSGSTPRSGT